MKFLLLFFALVSVLFAQLPAGYQLTTVPLPKGAVTVLGLCHKPDGTLAVVSWEGEVWEYKNKIWSKFADNLMEPNGIYFDPKEEAYYVAQKPELTRLIDSDKDGICDRYECVTDAFGISGEYHEYHYGPVVDSLGRKYASLNLAARGSFVVPDGKEVGKGSGGVKLAFDSQGRLWSAQVGRGWFSVGGKRTALQYAEWDGKTTPFAIHSTQLTQTGFSVTFTEPLGQEVTPTVSNYHYHYYSTYGSPMVDLKEIPVTNYQLSEDRKTVTFDVPLTAGKVYAIKFPEQQSGSDKTLDFDTIYYTANKLLPAKEARQKKPHAIQLVGSGWIRNDKTRPLPPVVTPLPEKDCVVPMPANATLLDASQWTNPSWKFDADGVMPRSKGNNSTKQSYGSARLHLEFRFDPSDDPQWTGQLYGNTGVFLQSGYELQVVNSYQNPTFADGHCGSIYGQHPPRANACRKPGEWQSYDILYKAPEFHHDGSLKEPLRVTMYHNGILIHNDAWTYGEVGKPYQKHGKRPLMIQDHKGTGVSLRNLWIVSDIDYDQSLDSFLSNF
ncbi:DUF1080 domain-containing protein, partial [Akkermansiaceae bacterium]|nr:DUF1080 domain-containing protein [Akkermansiaceae bacterium]